MASPAEWEHELLWLSWQCPHCHEATAAEAAALQKYFTEYPRQLTCAGMFGKLPLHCAASLLGKHAVAIVAFLLKARRDATQWKSNGINGEFLPLHYAAQYQTGDSGAAIVTLLLEAYPEGAMQRDYDGRLPADFAEKYSKLPASCVTMLRAAAKGKSTPPTPAVAEAASQTTTAATPVASTTKATVTTGSQAQTSTATDAVASSAATSTTQVADEPKTLIAPTAKPAAAAAAAQSSMSTAFLTFADGDFTDMSATKIGSGREKTVFSAKYIGPATSTLQNDSYVALLYFNDGIAPNLYEYKVMTAIRAPHLAKFYGSVQSSAADDARICLVSELAPFGSLPHFLEKAEEDELYISLSHKLVIAKQAGDGLSALHEHNLVHGDVAARNVLVYAFNPADHHDTRVKLSDFGMVRERNVYSSAIGPADAAAPGEPLPLAPKWASWESLKKGKFYRASDVWSFGVLVWEILTECDTPYPDVAHTITAMTKHLKEGHRLPQPDDCSDALWDTLLLCWKTERTERIELEKVLVQVAVALDEVVAAAVTAHLTAIQAQMHAMQQANEAWLRAGYGWRKDGIELSADLDQELVYNSRGEFLSADLQSASHGSLAERLTSAISDLALGRGGSKGRRFSASVDAITLCKNHRLIASFNESMWKRHTERQVNQGTPRFNGRWDDPRFVMPDDLHDKQAVFSRLERLFADTDLGPGPGVKVTLMWHGVPSPEVANSICRTGLSSRVSGPDQGYFGRGIYLTPEAEYAAFFANGQRQPEKGKSYTLLLCAVCTANPYPLTRGTDYDSAGPHKNVSKFHGDYGSPGGTAKALHTDFDAHFVGINTEELWQAATIVADADYHELVVRSEEQVLPFAQVLVRIE